MGRQEEVRKYERRKAVAAAICEADCRWWEDDEPDTFAHVDGAERLDSFADAAIEAVDALDKPPTPGQIDRADLLARLNDLIDSAALYGSSKVQDGPESAEAKIMARVVSDKKLKIVDALVEPFLSAEGD